MSSRPDLDRRQILKQAALITASLSLPGSSGVAAADDLLPVVDTHQHLWDLSKFRLDWLAPGSDSKLNRNFLTDDYRKATDGLKVVKAVYMEVDVIPSQKVAEAESIIALCRSGTSPTVAAVIGGRPASEGFKEYVGRFKDTREVKGVRQVVKTPGACVAPEFIDGVRTLGEAGLMFDLCMPAASLPDAAKLVDACPDTRFILDHCGNADVLSKDRSAWKADLAAIAKRERILACKVSGIVASTKGQPWTPDDLAPIVNHVLDVFGSDRVVFGSDWPVCLGGASLRDWLNALKAIVRDRSETDRRKLFSANAERIYRLA